MISIGEVSFKFVFLRKQEVEVSGNLFVQKIGKRTVYISYLQSVQCNELTLPFLKQIFHQTQRLISKEMIGPMFYPKKESLDKDTSIKIFTFSSQPQSPSFHVVNVKMKDGDKVSISLTIITIVTQEIIIIVIIRIMIIMLYILLLINIHNNSYQFLYAQNDFTVCKIKPILSNSHQK